MPCGMAMIAIVAHALLAVALLPCVIRTATHIEIAEFVQIRSWVVAIVCMGWEVDLKNETGIDSAGDFP